MRHAQEQVAKFANNLCLVSDRLGEPVRLERFQEHIVRTLFSTDRWGNRLANLDAEFDGLPDLPAPPTLATGYRRLY